MIRGKAVGRDLLVVGLDSSTTATKAVAFDDQGTIVARAVEPLSLSSPAPNWYEQDPRDWWKSSCRALRTITHTVAPQKIAALAVSNQRETFVALDHKGRALRPAILWLDDRCKGEVSSFSRSVGAGRIHRITGKPPDYAPVLYRLAWMKRREPRLYRKIHMVCDVQSYLVSKLTGLFATSWASADPLGVFDIEKKRWSTPILRALNLATNQFPTVQPSGSILGRVSDEAARATGLHSSTLVVADGGDGQAAGLGANVFSPNRAYLNLGTAVVAGVFGREYRTSRTFRTVCSCFEEGYYYECSLRAGTFSIDWFIRNVLRVDPAREPGIYAQLEREASRISPGSDGLLYLPYLCGVMNPYWDMNARGMFYGLSPAHHRGHLYRAILEGIAFEQLLAVDAVERTVEKPVDEFVAMGGGAANGLWCRIIADITGREVLIPTTTDASALGAAIAAAVGSGLFRNFREAAGGMTRTGTTIRPEKKNQKIYRSRFEIYRELYPLAMEGVELHR